MSGGAHHKHHGKGHHGKPLPTSGFGILEHDLKRHAKEEWFSKQGYYGVQFIFDIVNPFFFLNRTINAFSVAKRNRGLLRAHVEKSHDRRFKELQAGLIRGMNHIPEMQHFFLTDPTGQLSRLFASNKRTMQARLERLRGKKKFDVDGEGALEKYGIKDAQRLDEAQIEKYLKLLEQREEVLAEYSLLKKDLLKLTQEGEEKFAENYGKFIMKVNKLASSLNDSQALVLRAEGEARAIDRVGYANK